MHGFLLRLLLPACILLCVTLRGSDARASDWRQASTATKATAPLFDVRRTGGLFPLAGFTIASNGTIRPLGNTHLTDPSLRLQPPVLSGLVRLARAEHFFRMPANILCHTSQTDVRSVTIAIRTSTRAHTVTLLTSCSSPRFTELYALLTAVTRISLVP
jgi:hypothetical protein